MKREIKFRYWCAEDKIYWAHSGININPYGEIFYKIGNSPWNIAPPGMFIPQQYTGCKDKNGKEIYEGDILLCHEYDSSDTVRKIIQTFQNAVVGFEKGSFYYYPKGNMKQPHQLLLYAYNPEIIGNIYENPELIK